MGSGIIRPSIASAGTLLQPKMKKKRSVTRLTAKDTQKASKYVLTHQDVDSDGTVTTKLVKVRLVRSDKKKL